MTRNPELKPVTHDNKSRLWCGPAVLSSITGKGTAEITSSLRRISGRAKIQGLNREHLCQFLLESGFTLSRVDTTIKVAKDGFLSYHRPTLAKWLKSRPRDAVNDLCIVITTRHYVAVKGRKFVDSHTIKPVAIGKAPFRRARVKHVITVRKAA